MPPKPRKSIEQKGRVLLVFQLLKMRKFEIFAKQHDFLMCPVPHFKGD